MWLASPNRIGVAGWQVDQSIWMVHAAGGQAGVFLEFGGTKLSLASSSDQELPHLEEQFVRGDELHLSFPQPEKTEQSGVCDFGFRLVLRPVELGAGPAASKDRIGMELLISIQTSLLDTHPTLDLVVPGQAHTQSSELTGPMGEIHSTRNQNDHSAIILGPHDAPYAAAIDGEGVATRVRLFGEFLEKGVIRRARPWLVLDRSGTAIDTQSLQGGWEALMASPVPLD